MPRRAAAAPKKNANWVRFNAYLRPEQMQWINKTRGRYMGETGSNLGGTDLLRIALSELEKMDWARLQKVIGRYLEEAG